MRLTADQREVLRLLRLLANTIEEKYETDRRPDARVVAVEIAGSLRAIAREIENAE